jgi:hypothetical protein
MLKLEHLAEAWEASAIAYTFAVDKPETAGGYGAALHACAKELRIDRAAIQSTTEVKP